MNEVKDICQRILDNPAPAIRDGAQVLAIARHAAQRRANIMIVASSLATAAIVAITAAALPRTGPDVSPLAPRVATASQSVGPPRVPARLSVDAHGVRIAQLLADSLPPGYTSRPAFGGRGTSTWTLAFRAGSTSGHYVSQTRIFVSNGDGEGALSATIISDNSPAPAGDHCSSAVAARLTAYTGDTDLSCEVITIDGVPIRAASTARNGTTATRFLAGGLLTIRWSQDTATTSGQSTDSAPWWEVDGRGRKPLTTSPLTTRQLAALAADPQMLLP